jgi:hypothetical protein
VFFPILLVCLNFFYHALYFQSLPHINISLKVQFCMSY